MAESSAFGSAAWTGGEEYGGEYTERIDDFLVKINASTLLSYPSSLREKRSCTISREFSVGNFNLVRRIEFEDGISWIARLRMPPMLDEHTGASLHSQEKVRLEMQSELDTMDFIRYITPGPLYGILVFDAELS
jgi:hypothetical protein